MACVLISDKQTEYSGFLTETANIIQDCEVKGIAMVFLCEGGEDLTAYWNMDVKDKSIAAANIQADIIDQIVMMNRDRYFGGEED